MKSIIRPEWEKYLLKENEDTTIEKVLDKLTLCISHLEANGMRSDWEFLMSPDDTYRIEGDDANKYREYFMSLGYDKPSALVIVTCMDAVYHMFDITMEEAKEFAEYAAENRLTLTDAIKEKMNVSIVDIGEFLDTVLAYNAKFVLEQTRMSLDELMNYLKNKMSN